ncbi:hypothetical protein ACROYT_G006275 [Oculina patagonica]
MGNSESSHSTKTFGKQPPQFPRLSSPSSAIKPHYDVVIVGSGYGASIAASRCARAGQMVCVLERGKEWLPGEFPETFSEASKELQISFGGKKHMKGKSSNLYEFVVTENVTVIQGCGLGGGSLINANVGLDSDPAVFSDPVWPQKLRDDLQNFTSVDRQHVLDMLKPTPYPDHYPKLHKVERMKEGLCEFDIEDSGKMFYKPSLYVTFEDTPANHVGIPQPKCTACGNCVGGCNVGAKNTLNMNYLPDAKAHGAKIFTEVEVIAVTKACDSSDWLVSYRRQHTGCFDVDEQIVRASHVILGAGSLGSTKILLRSKERGLDVSDQLGKRFTTNGDVLGFSYNGDKKTNSAGRKTDKGSNTEDKENNRHEPPGPCIASIIDFRKTLGGDFKDHFVIEDGTPPSIASVPYTLGVSVGAKVLGEDKFPSEEKVEKVVQELQGKGMDNTISFLCMSHDDASGQITFDKNHDNIDIEWKEVGRGPNFDRVNEALEKLTKGLGGSFVKNPMWTEALGKSVVTAHPLGGCPMGASGQTAVVNHAGQVFEGDSDEPLNGLYVVDGAILPRAVGINPVQTIACLAERCMRLMAEREGWIIDYDTFIPLDRRTFKKQKPGIRFTEKMVGNFEPTRDKYSSSPCEFTVSIESDDVERMIDWDPAHSAKISGTVTCPSLSEGAMTISQGQFKLFSKSADHVETKEMVYKMILTGHKGQQFAFQGVKLIHKDHAGEIGLSDTTTLFVTIYSGTTFWGIPVGRAKLFISLPNFAKQLATLEVTNTKSRLKKLKWISRFGSFFARTIWESYGPVTSKEYLLSPSAPIRKKRPLQLNGATPEVYKCVTEDKVELKLTRYKGGTKGPVILFHGLGSSSGQFNLDTVETNLTEYLVQHRYDVWLADWRASCELPWAVYHDYTLDDCAKYDCPALIDKVLEITKQKSLQMIGHCVGSLINYGALLSGRTTGKIRSFVSSQLAATPIFGQFNDVKLGIYIPGTVEMLGGSGMDASPENTAQVMDKLFNAFVKHVSESGIQYKERCQSTVCHRITFIYGLLWEHANLNSLTHETVHEFFGYVNIKCLNQLRISVKANKLLSHSGENIYLPDVDKKERLKSPDYLEKIGRLDFPITLIVGEKNQVFVPESTHTTYELMKEAHPNQEYDWIQIPDYSHIDCIIGKNAVYDVYPHILRALDRHAYDNLHLSEAKLTRISQEAMAMQFLSDDSESQHKVIQEVLEEVNAALPRECFLAWKSKAKSKNTFKQEPSYQPPAGTDVEQVVVHEMPQPNDPKKNLIICMSDLHLDSQWSEGVKERLVGFMEQLKNIAKDTLNTLILLGDVFEMWLDPFTISPQSNHERKAKWKKNEVCSLFISFVRQMAKNDDVKIFYIRGNHDHEMDAGTVRDLFGPNVEFIPGTLIYVINSDDGKQYRVRFAHGHDWDVFNSYSVTEPSDELCGKPIGYYVARAAATSDSSMSEVQQVGYRSTSGVFRCYNNLSRLPSTIILYFINSPSTQNKGKHNHGGVLI